MTRQIASSIDGVIKYFRVEPDAGDAGGDQFYWCCTDGACSKFHPDIDSTFKEGALHIQEFHHGQE